MPRIIGYKPQWIVANTLAGDGYSAWRYSGCEDGHYGEYTCGGCRPLTPHNTWEDVWECKAEDNTWSGLGEWVHEHGTVPRPPILVWDARTQLASEPGMVEKRGIPNMPVIADGHHRVVAAAEAGLRCIPLIVLPEWDQDTISRSWSNSDGYGEY